MTVRRSSSITIVPAGNRRNKSSIHQCRRSRRRRPTTIIAPRGVVGGHGTVLVGVLMVVVAIIPRHRWSLMYPTKRILVRCKCSMFDGMSECNIVLCMRKLQILYFKSKGEKRTTSTKFGLRQRNGSWSIRYILQTPTVL